MTRLTTLLVFVLTVCSASCQKTNQPPSKYNEGVTSGQRFFNYENTWVVSQTDALGVETVIGRWYDTVRIVAKSDGEVLIRKQYVKYINGTIRRHYDEVNRETLRPIHTHITTRTSDSDRDKIIADIQYSERTFMGTRHFDVQGTDEEIQAKINIQIDEPIYDWHLWGVLISGFPLQENYATKFLAHTSGNTSRTPFLSVSLHVTGSETVISTKWGKVDCWIVEVAAEVPWRFWIAKQHDVAPIQKIRIDESGEGTAFSWWKPLN